MRIRICLLTIAMALLPGWAQSDPPAEVTVPDAALRPVLEDSLGLAEGLPILAAELTELEARDAWLDRLTEAHQVTRSAKGSATRSRGDPAPRSIPVRVVTDTRTSAAAVSRLLETRGVTSDTLGAGGSGTRGILRADVPVSLLARLSEQRGVLGVSEEVPPRADNTGTQAQSSVTPALPHASPATEDTAEAAEVLRTGVVLEAGEIDSSTVAVGALVVAIHGQGERHPVSGEWGHLVTVRGYVQGVDAGTLTLSRTRDGRTERIALEHIQTLVAPDTVRFAEDRPGWVATPSTDPEGDAVTWSRAGADAALIEVRGDTLCFETAPDFEAPGDADENNIYQRIDLERVHGFALLDTPVQGAANDLAANLPRTLPSLGAVRATKAEAGRAPAMAIRDTADVSGRRERVVNRETSRRIVLKLGAGSLVGLVTGYSLAVVMASGVNDNSFGEVAAIVYGWWTGYTIGTAAGVALIDPHDRFLMAATGSLTGTWVGIKAGIRTRQEWLALLCPIAFAMIMSELTRDVPDRSRLSIGLVPDPPAGLSAVTTLRF